VELRGVALVLTQLHKAAWLYSGGSTMHTLSAHQRLGREGGRAGSSAASELGGSPRHQGLGAGQALRTPTHGPGPDSPKITYQRWQVRGVAALPLHVCVCSQGG
jgi:hypothetical protein